VTVSVLAALVAFVGVIQVRSQAEVERSLEGQDNTSLAFLIDDLHQSNDELAREQATLEARRARLGGGNSASALDALQSEAQGLRMVEGLLPVHGPGVEVRVKAPLSSIDVQDAVNDLQVGGAEAIAVNDRRVITGSVIKQGTESVMIDGASTRGPWTFVAIGDQDRLRVAADLMTRALQADPRVSAAAYDVLPDVTIRAVVTPRPYVYAS
jgi:uncharacterized protein YlxW (UPF0749 family)